MVTAQYRLATALRATLLPALMRFLEAADAADRKRLEERLASTSAAAFADQGAAFVAAIAAGHDLFAALEIALTAGRTVLQTAIQAATNAAVMAGIQQQVTALDLSFDLPNPRAAAYAEQHAAEMVTRIDSTTRTVIHDIIAQGTREGWSYDEIAKRITEQFAEFAAGKPQQHIDSRAHLVAVTEVGNAYEEGNLIVARGLQDAGLPMEKHWQTVGDARVSAGCRANEAAGWILLAEQFPSGHDRPLRFPGCRCTALYRRQGSGG